MKKIYEQVAKQCNVTPEEVEQEIAAAIKGAWENGNLPLEIKSNQSKIPSKGTIPTNEELIKYLAEKIKKQILP